MKGPQSRTPKRQAPRKEYKLPNDLIAVWNLYVGCQELRDRYVAVRWFGYKLAVKASAEAELWRTQFWSGIYKVYPKLKEKTIEYDRINQCVFEKAKP